MVTNSIGALEKKFCYIIVNVMGGGNLFSSIVLVSLDTIKVLIILILQINNCGENIFFDWRLFPFFEAPKFLLGESGILNMHSYIFCIRSVCRLEFCICKICLEKKLVVLPSKCLLALWLPISLPCIGRKMFQQKRSVGNKWNHCEET